MSLIFSKEKEKLSFIIEKIDNALEYKNRYKSIEDLLGDDMGWDATTMCIQQVGETLQNKLSDEFKKKFEGILPIKEAYWTRNYITHDYENLDKAIIENIIRFELPKLKETIEKILDDL